MALALRSRSAVAVTPLVIALSGSWLGCATEEDASSAEAEVGASTPRPPPPRRAPRPPPMGWNTWNKLRCDFDEATILAQADALVSSGMRDAGYDTLVLDDCWQGPRDAEGKLTWDARMFPRGLKALGAELHARKLKFGIYTAAGAVTCQWKPGSFGHEVVDAETFASWGVDFVKDDWCWHAAALEMVRAIDPNVAYTKMRSALDASGRDIVFSVASMGGRWAVAIEPEKFVGEWAPKISEMWRVGGDITDDWKGVTVGLEKTNEWAASASPGHYNDPDMLEVGNGGLTLEESRAHMSMWAMAGAPLIAGNDLRTMSAETLAILTNTDVIAIDQDRRMIQGTKVLETAEGLEVWSKPLDGSGVRAVALFNPTSRPASAKIAWSDVGLANGTARVRDVWAASSAKPLDGYEATVPGHSAVLLRVEGAEPAPPRGTSWVSDLVFTYAANHWGLVERDRSVGQRGPRDGHPMSIGGRRFEKGLGAHAPSDVRFRLGGACDTFEAEIGVDDETFLPGSSVFEIWADGARLFTSAVLTKGAARSVSVDVTGREELRLVTRGAGQTDYDHTDWANARLRCKP